LNRIIRFAALCLALVVILPSCAVVPPAEDPLADPYTVPILLRANAGMQVMGENPVSVKPGEDAVFAVSLDAGFTVRESSRYHYADGCLTVYNVRYPATVEVGLDFDTSLWGGLNPDQIPAGGRFSFVTAVDGEKYGRVETSLPVGEYSAATEITVTAQPEEGGRFVCWSLGVPVAEGGIPLALTAQYTFYLGADVLLCANFAPDTTATVLYDTNGGETAEGKRYLRSDAQVDFYYYPHALPSMGQMYREGYVLYAFNTAPDGSGTQYTFGSNVRTPESGTVMLYAQWAPVDPSVFSYTLVDGEAYITGCASDAEWVVLPETLEGCPVTTVKKGAIADLANMTTLVSNSTIQTFENESVVRCPRFTTMYLCDNIYKIADQFTGECPAFSRLYLGAARAPTRTKNEAGTFHIKFQRLMKGMESEKPMVIILSGSSSYYGFKTPEFDAWTDHQFYTVNFGTSVQLPALFFVEMFADFVRDGDIVIQASEYSEYQMGDFIINDFHWNCFENAPEIYSHVDIRNYRNIFNTLSAFNRVRDKQAETSYDDHSEKVDRYGEQGQVKPLQSPDYAAGSGMNFRTSLLNERGAARLNAAYAGLHARGAKVYFSFAPINRNALSAEAATVAYQNAYVEHLRNMLDVPVIGSVSDYILEGKYFYNSDYHTGDRGAEIRTKQLALDLLEQLKQEKN